MPRSVTSLSSFTQTNYSFGFPFWGALYVSLSDLSLSPHLKLWFAWYLPYCLPTKKWMPYLSSLDLLFLHSLSQTFLLWYAFQGIVYCVHKFIYWPIPTFPYFYHIHNRWDLNSYVHEYVGKVCRLSLYFSVVVGCSGLCIMWLCVNVTVNVRKRGHAGG